MRRGAGNNPELRTFPCDAAAIQSGVKPPHSIDAFTLDQSLAFDEMRPSLKAAVHMSMDPGSILVSRCWQSASAMGKSRL